MNRIRRILLPADLTSTAAALTAIRLAERFRAEITFLHVIDSRALTARFFFPKIAKRWIRRDPDLREEALAEERVLDFLKTLPLDSVPYAFRIVRGRLPQEILRAAERIRPDLLIQGSRISGLDEWMTGGAAWRIIRKAPCPVITVKQGEPARSPARTARSSERSLPDFQRILCLTSFGESSRMVLPYAAAVALKTDAELILLHLLGSGQESPNEQKAARSAAEAALDRLLQEVQALYPGVKAAARIGESGGEADRLARILDAGADMIAMGIGPLPDSLLIPSGGLPERIFRHARCSLLTANPEGASRRLERRYRKVFRRLTPEDLIRINDEQPELIGEDLFHGGPILRTSRLFLRNYSPAGLTKVFEEYGLFPRLREKGFADPRIAVQIDDDYRQRLRVFFGEEEDEDHLLLEMVLREGVLEGAREGGSSGRGPYFPVLAVEWITMQNPRASFSPERPPLPGQTYPGLGISREVLELIAMIGLRIRKDGIAIHPEYFHAALLYHPRFKCYNPVQEGQLTALIRDTGEHNLGDVSWAIHLDCLCGKNLSQRLPWAIDQQVLPLTDPLKAHFNSEHYRTLFREGLAGSRYRIDWRLFSERLRERTDPDRAKGRTDRSAGEKAPGGNNRDGSPPA